MRIVDAHLDLAYNAARGRDPRQPARQQPAVDGEIATVGLPDLRQGGVSLVCATLFARPVTARKPIGYRTPDEAHAQALAQLQWYRDREAEGSMRIVRNAQELPTDPPGQCEPLAGLLLMEGADPIRTVGDVPMFFDAGVRIVGLAWERTRYAGGTGAPGPLTPEGRELVRELDRFGIIHDASHLSDESFWNLLDVASGPLLASHSNCRAIVPGDRHLSDDMIRAIIARDGVIGINFYDQFLLPPEVYGKRRATLADVVRHIRHVCDLAGNANHVGLGTDMDGGLGRNEIPAEVQTSGDLHKVAESLSAHGFSDEAVRDVMCANWLRRFSAALPGAGQSG